MTSRNPRSYNPKRRIQESPEPEELIRLVKQVKYGGNPDHKRWGGNFGLTKQAPPRPATTLCEDVGISTKEQALGLLREGARRGLISTRLSNGFPQNIWAVTEDGVALEAQLENRTQGTYHGYPVLEADPLRNTIVKRWGEE